MLGPASSTQATTIDLLTADRVALRPGAVVPWRSVAIAALLALLLGLALVQGLAGSRSSLPAVARSEVRSREGLSSLPLTAQGPISMALGADDAAFRISESGNGFRTANPAQHLSARFDRAGVSLSSRATQLDLSLRAVGY